MMYATPEEVKRLLGYCPDEATIEEEINKANPDK